MIYTSRYANPELTKNGDKYVILQISVGTPRRQARLISGAIEELKPFGLLNITDKYEYRKKYVAHLNKIGIAKIVQLLEMFQEPDKSIVLCCYEDIRKMGDNWCHRTMFANWFFEQTGIRIEELPDPSPTPPLELSDTPFTDIFEGFF